MSGENPNFLMPNVSDNSINNIECVPQISQISLPSDISSNTTSTTTSVISSPRDSYSCFISGLTIDITNNSDNNTLPSSSSPLMPTSGSLILTLDAPNVSRNSVTSPIPPLIMPTIQNGFSQNITQQNQQIQVETVRQNRPYLRIIEQPTNRIRYRYRSEKGSHGGLTGENSSQTKKTYPTVKLENYHPSSQVYIRASLYTNEDRPKNHVHKLMGRHCNDEGLCTVPLSDNMLATFQNLGILFVGKKEVPDILYQRKLEETRILHSSYISSDTSHLSDIDKQRIREESEREAKDMNLNSVKICFEAFVYENEMSYAICSPAFSRPVANQKSPDSGELKIVRMDKYSGHASGDEEVFLLCEKVNKKEIKIRFFETDSEGNQLWEAFGNFTEADVHHQVAIVFRTPPYRDQNIESSVQVYLQLYRPRDGEYSEPRPFTYKPKEHDLEGVERKRKKVTHYNSNLGEIGSNSGTSAFIGDSFSNISEAGNTNQSSHGSNTIGFYGHSNCSHGYSKCNNISQNKSLNFKRNCGLDYEKTDILENPNPNICLIFS